MFDHLSFTEFAEIEKVENVTIDKCKKRCTNRADCNAWIYQETKCILKSGIYNTPIESNGSRIGVKCTHYPHCWVDSG